MKRYMNWSVIDKITKENGEIFYFVVYRGKDKKKYPENKKFVMKTLGNQSNLERRSRMLREISNLRSLYHPGITKVFDTNVDFFEDLSNKLFFVTEYVEGINLKDIVKEEKIDLQTKVQSFLQLIDTMEYCHDNGVYHQNISPLNVICRNNNLLDLVLIDYGLSFNTDFSEGLPKILKNMNQSFLVLPELGKFQNFHRHDPRSDIALCCGILFYLLTEQYPMYLLDHYTLKPHQRAACRIKLKESTGAHFNKYNRIFDIGFNVDLDKRFQSFQALRSEILDITDNLEEQITNKGVKSTSASMDQYIRKVETLDSSPNNAVLLSLANFLDHILKLISDGSKGTITMKEKNKNLDFQNYIFQNTYEFISEKTTLSTEFNIVLENSEIIVYVYDNLIKREMMRMPIADYNKYTSKLSEKVKLYYKYKLISNFAF
jgi:serine/threonine protein kinase